MAKGKKDKKIPKRIAGVKVPKDLRKRGGSLLALVEKPLAREIAVAAAFAAVTARKDAHKAAAKKAREQAGDAAEHVAGKVDWVGPALAAAAAEVGRRLVAAYQDKDSSAPGQAGGTRSSKAAKVVQLVGKLTAGTQR